MFFFFSICLRVTAVSTRNTAVVTRRDATLVRRYRRTFREFPHGAWSVPLCPHHELPCGTFVVGFHLMSAPLPEKKCTGNFPYVKTRSWWRRLGIRTGGDVENTRRLSRWSERRATRPAVLVIDGRCGRARSTGDDSVLITTDRILET